MKNIHLFYFSPTHTTKRAVQGIGQGVGVEVIEHDLTFACDSDEEFNLGENDIAIVGVPVYAGRVPEIAANILKRVHGNNTLAVAVVVYGNRAFEDALLELKNILKENGFSVIAGGAFIGEHSYTKKVGTKRPDNNDIEIAINFGKKIDELVKEGNYKKDIDVKFGVEVGVQPHTKDYLESVIKKYPFDFVIASSHAIDRVDLAFGEIQAGRTKDEVHNLYFEYVLQNIEKYNEFNVYGHIDFVTRYGGEKFRGLDYKKHFDIIDVILKKLIEKGKGIEVNTSGYRYREDRFYPCTDILKRYYELGGAILTIGSDSHIKDYMTMDFDRVYDFLESIGVKYISSFDKMQPSFKKIK